MKHGHHGRQGGFTLFEILVTSLIVGIVMMTVVQIFNFTIQAREEVRTLGEPMEAGPRILNLVERDLRSMWTFNIQGNRVLRGENRTIAGIDADRMDMLCARPTAGIVRLNDGSGRRAYLAEVGYWVREDRDTGLFQLWRREAPMVDDEPWRGGAFQLVHDRLRSFNVTYFESLGKDAEPLDQWDSQQSGTLPRRVRVEVEIERRATARSRLLEAEDFEGQKVAFERHIVLDARIPEALTTGLALVPVRPLPPEAENTRLGPLGGGPGGLGMRGGREGGPGGVPVPPGTAVGSGDGQARGVPLPDFGGMGGSAGGFDLRGLIGGTGRGGAGGGR